MLSSGMQCYHLELMLSSGTTCYHLGLHVIIWDKMLSSGGNVIMVSSGANVIIWCYHVMLSSGMITPPFFVFPGNFTHSNKTLYLLLYGASSKLFRNAWKKQHRDRWTGISFFPVRFLRIAFDNLNILFELLLLSTNTIANSSLEACHSFAKVQLVVVFLVDFAKRP
jgi:hypothetical protein